MKLKLLGSTCCFLILLDPAALASPVRGDLAAQDAPTNDDHIPDLELGLATSTEPASFTDLVLGHSSTQKRKNFAGTSDGQALKFRKPNEPFTELVLGSGPQKLKNVVDTSDRHVSGLGDFLRLSTNNEPSTELVLGHGTRERENLDGHVSSFTELLKPSEPFTELVQGDVSTQKRKNLDGTSADPHVPGPTKFLRLAPGKEPVTVLVVDDDTQNLSSEFHVGTSALPVPTYKEHDALPADSMVNKFFDSLRRTLINRRNSLFRSGTNHLEAATRGNDVEAVNRLLERFDSTANRNAEHIIDIDGHLPLREPSIYVVSAINKAVEEKNHSRLGEFLDIGDLNLDYEELLATAVRAENYFAMATILHRKPKLTGKKALEAANSAARRERVINILSKVSKSN